MDKQKPSNENKEKVVLSKEFFWRQFNKNLLKMLAGSITKKDFVDNMMKLGYTEKQLKEIFTTKKEKPHDTQ